MSEPFTKAQDLSMPDPTGGLLLVGPPSLRATPESFGPGLDVVSVEDTAQAEHMLATQGYRFAAVILPMKLDGNPGDWVQATQGSFPWIAFVLEGSPGESAGEVTRILAPDPSRAPRPYQAGEMHFLREAGPLLVSLCRTNRPWDLEAEGVVLPVGRGSSPFGALGHAWVGAVTSSVPELEVLVLDALGDRVLRAERPEVAGVFRYETGAGSHARHVLMATSESSANVANASIAVESMRAAIELATTIPGLNTLVLPLVGTGDGDLDSRTVLLGLLEEYDPKTELGDLRHVIVTVLEEEVFERLREPAVPDFARGQRIENDTPRGPDRLGVQTEVEALADTIALEELDPPLVVGILGGWGAGKSFALHLLRERLRRLRTWDLTKLHEQQTFPFVGHVYMVRFDAWTYAKSDLWASLMHAILTQLDQQLSLEGTIGEAAGTDAHLRGIDVWDVLEKVTTNQRELLKSELAPEIFERVTSWSDGDVGDALWGALEETRGEVRERLDTKRKELDSKERDFSDRLAAERLKRSKLEAAVGALRAKAIEDVRKRFEQRVAEQEIEVAKIEARVLEQVEGEFEGQASLKAWDPVLSSLRTAFGEKVRTAWEDQLDEAGLPPGSVQDVVRDVSGLRKAVGGLTWPSAAAAVAGLSMLFVPNVTAWIDGYVEGLSNGLSNLGVLPLVGSAVAVWGKYRSHVEEAQKTYTDMLAKEREARKERREATLKARMVEQVEPERKRLDELRGEREAELARLKDEQEETQSDELAKLIESIESIEQERDRTLAKLRGEVAESERLVGLTLRGASVHDLIRDRLASGEYDGKLGVVHRVQEDLRELSDALHPREANLDTLFPRGRPRVVIVIDDLDRCPPDKVVDVLEAAQLLVKTPLFVVVIAADVRYVTRALETQYKGILVTDGIPSGLDYIEKIVQIPYRVPDIDPAQMRTFLGQQMTFVQRHEDDGQDSDAGASGARAPSKVDLLGDQDNPVFRSMRTADEAADDESPLPTSVQHFEHEELEILNKCCQAAEVSPRTGKRLVNVFKLLKIIWHHRGVHREPTLEVKQGMLLLLALSARYPVVMRELLRDLDGLLREESMGVDKLTDILIDRVRRMRNDDNKRVVDRLIVTLQSEALMPSELTLNEMRHENLRLVRSFSFVGETSDEFDPKPDEVEAPGDMKPAETTVVVEQGVDPGGVDPTSASGAPTA